MADAVRFYWRGREAGISLATIPDTDRNPLRLRRWVVQASAPEVIAQLEAGQFVAASWESAGSMFLILCHPNLAKGPDDSVLVDEMSRPTVTLKLGSGDNISEISRLLLTAFGSEAASIQECTVARRDIEKWLSNHGQSETANAVRHFSAFPFDVRSNALEIIAAWRSVLVKGQKEEIDGFLDQVKLRFEGLGWTRDPVFERRLNRHENQTNRFYSWASSPDHGPRVVLCLNRATERRIRGSTYDIDERAAVSDLASAIQHILVDVLEPAAAALGLEISYPHLGPISRVESRTASTMTALAESGDGRWPWPLSDELERIWRAFVLTACRDDTAFHPAELTAWFIASGWDEQAAAELTKRFYADAAVLREYEEAERQPA
jgi:hypothetical protein